MKCIKNFFLCNLGLMMSVTLSGCVAINTSFNSSSSSSPSESSSVESSSSTHSSSTSISSSFDDTFDNTRLGFSGSDVGKTIHAVGGFNMTENWEARNDNIMESASLFDIAGYDVALATKLKNKNNLKYLFMTYVQLNQDRYWTVKALKNGVVKTYNGGHAIKALIATRDGTEENLFVNDRWIPNPFTTNAESLTDNLFMPIWQENPDSNGFSWCDNPVCTDEDDGSYIFVAAQYDTTSTFQTPEFGLGLIRLH